MHETNAQSRDIGMTCDPGFANYIASSVQGEHEGKEVCYANFILALLLFHLKETH
jgi:hypothetical protein